MKHSNLGVVLWLLAIDIVIAVGSWYIPTDIVGARSIAAGLQLVFLIVTGISTVRLILSDF